MSLVENILDRLFPRTDVGINQEEFGVLLKRWHVWMGCRPHVYIHKFCRSDHDRSMHDHPWHFRSIILWGGYWEHTPAYTTQYDEIISMRKWYRPGSYLNRPAKSIHRVELKDGKPSWSLCITGERERDWGFWIKVKQWCKWDHYNPALGICEDNFVTTDKRKVQNRY
jgi:hypothetical protein